MPTSMREQNRMIDPVWLLTLFYEYPADPRPVAILLRDEGGNTIAAYG